MRITEKMISMNLFSNVSRAREQMGEVQADLASTRQLRNPSDDPTGYFRASNFKLLINRNEQYLTNINRLSERNTATLAALDSAVDFLANAKEAAMRAGNGHLDDTARASLVSNVDQILASMLEIANTQHNGKYVFAGTKTLGDAPFVQSANQIDYEGNAGLVKSKIGDQVEVVINKPGDKVFVTDGGLDILNSVLDLKKALEQDDPDAVQNSISNMDAGIQHLLKVSADFGLLQDRVQLTGEFLSSQNVNLTAFASEIEDTDMLQASVDFQSAQTAYTAGLKAFSELVQTSLLNFIG